MACTDCITYKFTNDEGIGTLEFIAEDPNGLSLVVQSITLFFTDGEGEVTEFLVLPGWFDYDAIGDLISVGGLYRITLTLTFDFFAANEAGFGPGNYSGRVCFKRSDGSYTDLCCDYEVCSDAIDEPIPDTPVDVNTVFFAGSVDQGRVMSCTTDTGDTTVTTIIGDDPFPGVDFSGAAGGVAFCHVDNKLFFTAQSADRIYRCDIDGSNVEVYYNPGDFGSKRIRQMYIIPGTSLMYIELGSSAFNTSDKQVFEIDVSAAAGAASRTLIFSHNYNGAQRGNFSSDEDGRLYWTRRNASSDAAVFRYNGAEVVELFSTPSANDEFTGITIRFAEGGEIFVTDDTNAGTFEQGTHVYDLEGNYLRFGGSSPSGDGSIMDNTADMLVSVGSGPAGDVKIYDPEDLGAGSATIGNITGSTGSIFSGCLGYIEP